MGVRKSFAINTDIERFLIIKAFTEEEAYQILAEELLKDEYLLHYIQSMDTDDGLIYSILNNKNTVGNIYKKIDVFWNNTQHSNEYKRNYQLHNYGEDVDNIKFSNEFLIFTIILVLKKGLWYENFNMLDLSATSNKIEYLYQIDK